MKKLIFILLTFTSLHTIFAQNFPSAREWDVLPVPDFFNKYVRNQDIVDIENNRLTIESFYKDARSNVPWIVYSDRSNNGYDDDYSNGFKAGELKIGHPLVVYKVKGNRLLVGNLPVREGRNYTKDVLGWIDAKRLILSSKAVLGTKGGPRKGMVLVSVNAFKKGDDIVEILENNYYFQTPLFTGKNAKQRDTQAKKFKFLFILKQTPNGYLLSNTDNLLKDVKRSHINIRGWLPSGKITLWEHRVCLEPNTETSVVDKHEGKDFHVIDDENNFDKYLQSGQLESEKWSIRKINLEYERPLAHVMRMPIISGWSNETENNKKIAAIAQMIAQEDEDEPGSAKIENKGDDIATTKTQLSKMENLAKQINILFVIDGTASLRKYGPAASNAVSEFMKTMRSDLSGNNFRFALGVYRHYIDSDNSKYPDYEFENWTSNENTIKQRLENLTFNSKNPKHEESLFMGLTRSINDANFREKETNIVVLIGDAGNDNDEYRSEYTLEKIADLVHKKNINLISFQVNYPANKAYAFFNKEVGQIIQKSAQKHVQYGLNKGLDTYNDYRFDHNGNNQTFNLMYTGSNTLTSNDIAPSFGFFKYAVRGGTMNTDVFEMTLVNTLKDYVEKVDNLTTRLAAIIDGSLGETGEDLRKDRNGEIIRKIIWTDKTFIDYLKRLGFTDEAIDELRNAGEISAQGYFSINHPNVYSDDLDEPAFKPVIFISKDYKNVMDSQLDKITSASANLKSSDKKRNMFNAIIGILKSIMGEQVSTDLLQLYSFDEVWLNVLGVPFNGNPTLKNQPIEYIKTEMSDDDFNDFYSDFKEEVREFKLFNPDDDYTKWKKAGQTWYWIPLDIVPGCEENF